MVINRRLRNLMAMAAAILTASVIVPLVVWLPHVLRKLQTHCRRGFHRAVVMKRDIASYSRDLMSKLLYALIRFITPRESPDDRQRSTEFSNNS
jgi:hypothetical protein